MSHKSIIGVPVLPGFAPVPDRITVDVDDNSSNASGGERTIQYVNVSEPRAANI